MKGLVNHLNANFYQITMIVDMKSEDVEIEIKEQTKVWKGNK